MLLEASLPKHSHYEIGGSVIQRSFIPAGLGVTINIATVPFAELCAGRGGDGQEIDLRQVTAEILGLPSNLVLDDSEYGRIVRSVAHDGLLESRRAHPFWHEFWYEEYRELREGSRNRLGENTPALVTFAKDSLMLIAGGASPYAQLPLFWGGPRSQQEFGSGGELGRSSEAVRVGLSCLIAATTAEAKVRGFVDELTTYDIPSGQSPKTESDSLLRLIETGKKICLAPLAAAGALGVTQLGQGGGLQPILTVATGSAMTLILVSTLSVSDLVVRYLMQRRPPPQEGAKSNVSRGLVVG